MGTAILPWKKAFTKPTVRAGVARNVFLNKQLPTWFILYTSMISLSKKNSPIASFTHSEAIPHSMKQLQNESPTSTKLVWLVCVLQHGLVQKPSSNACYSSLLFSFGLQETCKVK